jgi:predicted NAD/FAD-binding protein
VIRRMTYLHPVYTRESVATQTELPRLNGRNRTHFCGAYFGNGFHEDGLNAAIAVADDLGVVF